MSDPTRRDLTKWLMGGTAAAAAHAMLPVAAFARTRMNSTVNGVKIGAVLYSFREVARNEDEDFLGVGIRGCVECNLGDAELWSIMALPQTPLPRHGQFDAATITPELHDAREQLRVWRRNTPASYWRNIRKRFNAAGIHLLAYTQTLADDFTDEEIDQTLLAVRAMGIQYLGTNQTRVAMARRAVPFAERHDVSLCFHNHSRVNDSNEVASVESMEAILAMSRHYHVNLDIGHFVGGNGDPVSFIRKHHDRIKYLHLKDRKRNDGPNMPWGQGDTPIGEVLQLIKRERYPIPCLIEYEHKSDNPPLVEVRRCIDYIERALA